MANAPGALTAALRPVVAIAVPATVTAGQNVSLSGAASGAACNRSVTTFAWTAVSPTNYAIHGANSAAATIVAPSSGTVTLRLTVTDDAGHTDSGTVVVSSNSATTAAPAAANNGTCVVPGVSVSPTTSSVQAGGSTQTFTADTDVSWYVDDVLGGDTKNGSISTSGIYTPPASVPSPNVVTVKAVWTSDTTKYATAQVTINAPVSIYVTPVVANVPVGSTQTFTAAVVNATSTSVTWSVNGIAGGDSSVGTISSGGVYTAPAAIPSPPAVTITAASTADFTKSASAKTTVTATSAGSGVGSSASSSSASGGGSGGGGPMDPFTLLAGALAVGVVAKRRHAACEYRHV